MIFIDGENLVFRFQDMVKEGAKPLKGIEQWHIDDICVWADILGTSPISAPLRINYYTSATGTEEQIIKIREHIREFTARDTWAKINAFVFKKEAKKRKSKLVDMSICIDALRHTYQDDIEVISLASGDGVYLPLIREIQRRGKRVQVLALSSGLEPELRRTADRFMDLDGYFFEK